jgi:hypothetical protein
LKRLPPKYFRSTKEVSGRPVFRRQGPEGSDPFIPTKFELQATVI